jgi:hypothetical protein
MSASPALISRTSPSAATVATLVLVLDHATCVVTERVEPSERRAVAESCSVVPAVPGHPPPSVQPGPVTRTAVTVGLAGAGAGVGAAGVAGPESLPQPTKKTQAMKAIGLIQDGTAATAGFHSAQGSAPAFCLAEIVDVGGYLFPGTVDGGTGGAVQTNAPLRVVPVRVAGRRRSLLTRIIAGQVWGRYSPVFSVTHL